ncbi:hypothetical protein AURDEDRAFT_166945 [Auricularia subglabra TFB-10046 SS5]|nr:hypothetical protein AURDEDRAFT_166945 [Auricularia subglabra TFB-10046 SS5]
MSLASDHDVDILQDCLVALLERHAGDVSSESDAVRVIQALQTTWDRTIADFSERWNARCSMHIPPELLAQCFEHLRFTDRLTVSSVSRQWRTMALAAPRLWCSFRITGQERHPGKLVEMLKRSQAAPLSIWLNFRPDNHDQAARMEANTLVHQHFSRLVYIAFQDQSDFLSLPAPRLEGFEALSYSHTDIPADLCGGLATRLRKIVVYSFTLPLACPALQNLQDFLGDFSDAESLFRLVSLCPRLVSLAVLCNMQLGQHAESLLDVVLPASVERLRLLGLNPPQNLPLAEKWAGRRFKHLLLQTVPNVDGALRHFVASHDRPWTMEIWGDGVFKHTLRTCTPEGRDALETVAEPSFDHKPADVAAGMLRAAEARQLDRLTTLTIAASLFIPFVQAGVQLPAVVALSLHIQLNKFDPPLYHLAATIKGSIVAPRLQSFEVTCTALNLAHEIWLFGVLPLSLRSWLKYGAERLQWLSLCAEWEGRYPTPNGMSEHDLAQALDELADCVEYPALYDFLTEDSEA